MARARREIEFTLPDDPEILAEMVRLDDAHAGWINFLPGVDEDELEAAQGKSPFAAVFGGAAPPVAMATWFPRGTARKGCDVVTVGIGHPRGRFAVRLLGNEGLPLPAGWRVRQDHARRGIILDVPPEAPHGDVLDWLLKATVGLTVVPCTGSWQARVFTPVRTPGRHRLVDPTDHAT